MKFCCDKFEIYYSTRNTLAPNIRIVKFVSEFLILRKAYRENQIKSSRPRDDIRFFITMGYENFKLHSPLMTINFCPFCGKNLHEYYNKDECANEIEGETFKL